MSNVLIPINFDGEQPTVSARDLHAGLGISERFQSWFNRQLQYGFQESTDYVGCKEFNTLARQELQDYEISVDMAKQICMIQRSEKGRQYRQYFIDLEKAYVAMGRTMRTPCRSFKYRSGFNLAFVYPVSDIWNTDGVCNCLYFVKLSKAFGY